MRSKLVTLSVAIVVVLAACQRHESTPTGSYGDRVVSGQVVMASEVANSSPAGVEVSVVGTGMTSTLAADGRFTFVGVPDDAQITFRRADGVSATIHAADASGLLQLGTKGVEKTGGKRRGTSPNDPVPHQEIEGTITNVAADGSTITVHDSHGKDDVIALTAATLIRKGDKVVKPADLAQNDRVHVKAVTVKGVLTALQVIVQDQDDDHNDGEVAAVGTVTSASGGSLLVTTKKGDVTVKTDANTIVMKDGQKAAVADIKTGDFVAAEGTRVDATTILARVIEAHSPVAVPMAVEGTVKSVSGSSVIVTTKKGEITVNTDANTVIRKNDKTITIADIQAGDRIEAVGTRVDASTMLAKAIEVRNESLHFMEVEGTVKSVGTDSVVVTTEHGDVTVKADANTVIRRDDKTATIADIKTGDRLEAAGTSVDATTLLARIIEVRSATGGH